MKPLTPEEMDGFTIIEPAGDLAAGYSVDRFRKFVPGIEQAGTDKCWIWEGAYSNQYPVYWDSSIGVSVSAPRWAYDTLVGPVHPDSRLERKCGDRRCVNPFHGRVVRLGNE